MAKHKTWEAEEVVEELIPPEEPVVQEPAVKKFTVKIGDETVEVDSAVPKPNMELELRSGGKVHILTGSQAVKTMADYLKWVDYLRWVKKEQ